MTIGANVYQAVAYINPKEDCIFMLLILQTYAQNVDSIFFSKDYFHFFSSIGK